MEEKQKTQSSAGTWSPSGGSNFPSGSESAGPDQKCPTENSLTSDRPWCVNSPSLVKSGLLRFMKYLSTKLEKSQMLTNKNHFAVCLLKVPHYTAFQHLPRSVRGPPLYSDCVSSNSAWTPASLQVLLESSTDNRPFVTGPLNANELRLYCRLCVLPDWEDFWSVFVFPFFCLYFMQLCVYSFNITFYRGWDSGWSLLRFTGFTLETVLLETVSQTWQPRRRTMC